MNTRINIITFACVAFLTLGLQSLSAGDVTGKITLKGTPPAERPITPLKDDPHCGKLHTTMPTTKFFVVGDNGALADTVVMLKGITGKSTGASSEPMLIDQRGCEYIPQIVAVQTGQKILVRNSDPLMHNVHPIPSNTAGGNKEDNKAQMAGQADLVFAFPAPENFLKFQCDVHRWMFTWVTVVDHPYYAVSGKDGSFTIKNVPPGKYTVTALHRKAAPDGVDQEIEVTADGAKADFTLEVK
jgi:plastocyanin